MKNKYLFWLIGIVVLLLIIWAATKSGSKQPSPGGGNTATTTQKTAPLQVTKTEVPQAEAPQGFPSDIPIEAGATITQNYNATAANGLFQATRVFDTQKSLDDNFTLYSNYLKSGGWTVLNSLDLANTKVLSAKKGSGNLQITISQNTITKANTVDITFSSQK